MYILRMQPDRTNPQRIHNLQIPKQCYVTVCSVWRFAIGIAIGVTIGIVIGIIM
jgi:ABC-type nitrate/sulfonate/bicarbonate transport system permease component